MGFIKSMITSLFNPSIESASSETPTITGRDLVSSTSSEEVSSPVMGGDKKKVRNNGISSLLVPSESLYKKGVK